MKPEIIDQLLQEAKDLQKKLDAVNATLSAYGHAPTVTESVKTSQAEKSSNASDKTQKVRERCLPLITAQNGVPMKTRDILKVLKDENYEIGGKNEVATLSAMLSNSGEFKAIGRSGWVLKAKNSNLQEPKNEYVANKQPSQGLIGTPQKNEAPEGASVVGGAATPPSNVNQAIPPWVANTKGGGNGPF